MSEDGDLGGYVSEVPYPAALMKRITPAWLMTLAVLNGVRPPGWDGAFRYLDLGCGDGLALALMAASHPRAQIEGVDGLAAHIARGRAFGRGLGNLTLTHQVFAEAMHSTAPPADMVVAHGVMSWVEPSIRDQVMDLAAARVAPDGIVALSYNALPGWSGRLAYQKIVHQAAAQATGDPAARFWAGHALARRLAEAGAKSIGAATLAAVEDIADRVAPDYFPHEYLNTGWQPLWGAEVRTAMAERGLSYLGQAEVERTRPDLALKPAQRALLAEAGSEAADTLFDVIADTPFRIDLYARAPEPATVSDRDAIWLMAARAADVELNARAAAGTLKFDNPAARAVMAALQDGPRRIAGLIADLPFGAADIRNACDCLLMGEQVLPGLPPSDDAAADQLNRRLSAEAGETGRVAIATLAGVHGPVRVSPAVIAMLHSAPDALLDRARRAPQAARAIFEQGTDLDDPGLPGRMAAQRQRDLAALARLGVPVPDL